MKKIYLSIIALATFSFVSVGQYDNDGMMRSKTKSEPVKGIENYSTKAPGDIIGAVLDFSNPANWSIDNSGVTSIGWVIGTDGPTGGFSGGMGPINSTSGGNFALFDADTHTGVGYIEMVNSVDCSAQANVAFEFESYYRNFQGSAFFEISVDGTNWTAYEVHGSLPLNENTANPELVSVNISAVAGNQPTVWARFRYDSADDYAWMVDDVKFVEGFNNELILEDIYMTAGVEGLDYYQIPSNQLQGFTYGAMLSNGGIYDQQNTLLNVKVNDGTSDIYDESSNPITANAFSGDSLGVTTEFLAPGDGTYTTTYNLSSDSTDQNLQNNTKVLEPIIVGGNVYARDNGQISGSVGHLGATPVETLMGQYFEFTNEFFIGQVEVGIAASSVEGSEVYVELRKLSTDGTSFDFVAGSNPYVLEVGDIGNDIRLDLTGGYTAQAGDVIEVLAGHFGSPDVRIATAQIGFGAVIYNEGARSQQNSLFRIRPILSFAGLENESHNNLLGINVYPNPVEDNFSLKYNLSSASDIEIEIRDVTGKVVYTLNQTGVKQGGHVLDLNASSFNSGVYFAVVKSNKNVAQRKFIVK